MEIDIAALWSLHDCKQNPRSDYGVVVRRLGDRLQNARDRRGVVTAAARRPRDEGFSSRQATDLQARQPRSAEVPVRGDAVSSALQLEHPRHLPATEAEGRRDKAAGIAAAPASRACHLRERRPLRSHHCRGDLTFDTASAPAPVMSNQPHA